jgi:phytoene synthase
MRILPRARREAIFEIYGFCRAVDDVADGNAPRSARLLELQRWRSDVEALYRGIPPVRLQGLLPTVRAFALDKKDLLAILDGMEMDIASDIRAPDLAVLDLYCDRAASAVGRLCVKVFGMVPSEGEQLAHHLGRALQLTNILRDLDEDAGKGRLYLPREALNNAGIMTSDPYLALSDDRVAEACAYLVEQARSHFSHADAIMQRSPQRTVRAPRIMAEAYKLKLAALERRGWTAPRKPVKVNRLALLWSLARCAIT